MIINPWELVERPFWADADVSDAQAWQVHQDAVRAPFASDDDLNAHARLEMWGFDAVGWCRGCHTCDDMGFGHTSTNVEYRRGPNHLRVWLCLDQLDCMECGNGMDLAEAMPLLRLEETAVGDCPGCQLPRP